MADYCLTRRPDSRHSAAQLVPGGATGGLRPSAVIRLTNGSTAGSKSSGPCGAAGHGQVICGLDPLVVDVQKPQLAVVPARALGKFKPRALSINVLLVCVFMVSFLEQETDPFVPLPHALARLMKARRTSEIERVTWPLPVMSSQ